jgi:dihydroflavonol-4-reductase
VNVEGTRNVVEAALAAGVERFVYTSTDDVLVGAPGEEFDESVVNPTPGVTPYQRSKQEADRVVVAALDRGLPAVFLHPAGVYGPAPFLVKGLNDLLMQLAKRKTPAVLPGGMAVAYSEDVADGHVRAAAQAPVGARYLLAESFQTLTEIAEAVAAAEPSAKVPRVMPLPVARAVSTVGEGVARVTGKPPMIARSVLQFLERGSRPSGARARAELGWEPTPFATGVERTLAYFRQQGWI